MGRSKPSEPKQVFFPLFFLFKIIQYTGIAFPCFSARKKIIIKANKQTKKTQTPQLKCLPFHQVQSQKNLIKSWFSARFIKKRAWVCECKRKLWKFFVCNESCNLTAWWLGISIQTFACLGKSISSAVISNLKGALHFSNWVNSFYGHLCMCL